MTTVTVELVNTSCWCGLTFAIPRSLYDEAHRKEHDIYCPTGHTFVFGNTEIERLKRELSQTRDARDRAIRQRDNETKAHSATKGQLTKARKRAANGVCPCCHRSFVNVARHVKTKHPDYEPDD